MYIDPKFTQIEYFKFENNTIKYRVNEEKKTVTAIAKFYMLDNVFENEIPCFTTVGVAKLKDGDKFDVNIGKKIARAKAEKEAFIKYKVGSLKAIKRLEMVKKIAENTVSKMNKCIEHQKEYLSKF